MAKEGRNWLGIIIVLIIIIVVILLLIDNFVFDFIPGIGQVGPDISPSFLDDVLRK